MLGVSQAPDCAWTMPESCQPPNSFRSVLTAYGGSEQRKLQFRFEVFDAPNTPNFFLPEKNVYAPAAVTITRAAAGREMQFALTYLF